MDYTIIGGAVNLTARLQSHSEIDGVLLGHETNSLVRDDVAVEEQNPDQGERLRRAGPLLQGPLAL